MRTAAAIALVVISGLAVNGCSSSSGDSDSGSGTGSSVSSDSGSAPKASTGPMGAINRAKDAAQAENDRIQQEQETVDGLTK